MPLGDYRGAEQVGVAYVCALYMGCSDVSEFEHIYGQMTTTPSCMYDPLFT